MVCSYSLKGLGFRRFLVCAFGPRMPAVPCGARPHVGRGHAKPPHTMVSEGLEWGVAPQSGEIMAVRIGNGRMESEWLESKRGPAESVWLREKSHGSAAGVATFIICPFIVCTFIPGESAGIWILRIVISRLVRVAIARRRPYGRGTIRGR